MRILSLINLFLFNTLAFILAFYVPISRKPSLNVKKFILINTLKNINNVNLYDFLEILRK